MAKWKSKRTVKNKNGKVNMIAAIAEKKKFNDHMETTLQRSQRQRSSAIVVAAIAGECLWFHMIAIYWSLGSLFFLAIAAITAMVAIIWKPGFKLIMAYFKSRDCLQRNLYLNCVSLWKALKANVWSVSISAVVGRVCWFQWLEWSYCGLFIGFSE